MKSERMFCKKCGDIRLVAWKGLIIKKPRCAACGSEVADQSQRKEESPMGREFPNGVKAVHGQSGSSMPDVIVAQTLGRVLPNSVMIVYGPSGPSKANFIVAQTQKPCVEMYLSANTVAEVSDQLGKIDSDFIFRPGIIAFRNPLTKMDCPTPDAHDLRTWAVGFESSLSRRAAGNAFWHNGQKSVILDAKAGVVLFHIMWHEVVKGDLVRFVTLMDAASRECG